MLKRNIDDDLLNWKNSRSKKVCLIEGARQVGKTYSAREFGRKNYKCVFELNFLEDEKLKQIFSSSLDADSILSSIRLNFPEKSFIENDTLIFLDEIQECAEAITALKFLSRDERFDVIATGSALGLAYKSVSSFPVGSIFRLSMHPLGFEEFLLALGVGCDIIDSLREHYENRLQINDAIHSKMLEYLAQYMVVGGMPEVVQNYVDTKNLATVHSLQKNIYQDYINDIARFSAPDIKIKAESCYKSIPQQLTKENHKFQYSKVEKRGNARKFETSVDWLVSAHLARPVFNLSKIEYPCKSFKLSDNFRLYMNDIGLLISTYDISIKHALLAEGDIEGTTDSNLILRTAKGGIFESLAAEILAKNGHDDLYFFRNKQGNIEIDFLIESEYGPLPIEIKAGAKTKTKSLNRVIESGSVTQGYKFGSQNIGVQGKKTTLPIYLLMFV